MAKKIFKGKGTPKKPTLTNRQKYRLEKMKLRGQANANKGKTARSLSRHTAFAQAVDSSNKYRYNADLANLKGQVSASKSPIENNTSNIAGIKPTTNNNNNQKPAVSDSTSILDIIK